MFNFFTSIANLIATMVDYAVSFFTSLIVLVIRSAQALAYAVSVLFYLPTYVKAYVLAMVGVSAILFVINKGSD